MGETAALIQYETVGAEQAAAANQKVATSMGTVATEGEKTTTSLSKFKKIESIGLKMVISDMMRFSGVAGAGRTVMLLLNAAIRMLLGTLGVLTGPIMLGVAAVGALIAVKKMGASWAQKYGEEMAKLAKQHEELAEGFTEAGKAGVIMTKAQVEYATALAEAAKYERALQLEQAKRNLTTQEEIAVSNTFMTGIAGFVGSLTGMTSLERKATEERRVASIEVLKLKASIESLTKAGMSETDWLKKQGEALKKNSDALKVHRDLVLKYQEIVKKGGVLTLEQKKRLDELTAAQTRERSGVIANVRAQIAYQEAHAGTATVIADLKAQLDALQSGFMSEEEAVSAAVKNAEALSEAQKNVKESATKAAKETRDKWMESTSGIRTSVENVGLGVAEAFRTGTGNAKELFSSFATSIVQELERMAIKAAVLQLFSALMPGAGAGIRVAQDIIPGFATGGVVPGPEGVPKMALLHGGERVESTTGLGGGNSGGNGGNVTHISVGGAFASMRDLQRAQRRSIRSTGELGLA